MKSSNIPGLTNIQDKDAESLVGGRFAITFITDDGQRITNRVNENSGTFDIPDNVRRIRVRNRNRENTNFIADFTNGTSNNAGDLFSLEGKSGTVVYRSADRVRSLDTGRAFTPNQITISSN